MIRLFFSAFLSAALAWPAELPVQQVVLYKHGVGFFERAGHLAPGEAARLDFNAAEMNDVLKSLTLEEKGGGAISGLRYDAMDPLSHKLAEFPFHLGDQQPLALMLDQLKGARLELQFGSVAVAGAIAGGRLRPAAGQDPEREQLTMLLDSGELRTVDLTAASGIRFTDPQLQQQFKDYLTALAGARSKDKRSVYIDSTDAQAHDVTASYMIPAPVWKSSYRLIFGSSGGSSGGDSGRPVLEGWAIVDNTTGEDWNKVRLALVSGRPISFVSQLYAPRYITRPEADLADDRAAQPVVHAAEFKDTNALARALARPAGQSRQQFQQGQQFALSAPPPPPAAPAASPEPLAEDSRVVPSSIAAGADAEELGDLFEYRIAQPVTIRKNESALLPFLQQKIDGHKLLIYSDRQSIHPTNAVMLVNDSGKTLDGGPITVYDGGVYAGEALVETLKSGDRRVISYAVDLGTRITDAFESRQAIVREMHAHHGVLTTKMAAEETRTYTIRNVDQKAKTLIVEHPIRQGYTVLNQKPASKTAANYRFEVPLAAAATGTFAVSEERIYDQTYAVSNSTPEQLVAYVRNRELSEAGRKQLEQIAAQKKSVAENAGALRDAEAQARQLTEDESRIRQNMMSLNSVSGQQQQVQNYARQLDAHEQQIAQLRDRQAELQRKKVALDAELDRLIEGMSF